MSPERWQQVEALFHAALEAAPAERAGLLQKSCAGDSELRELVVSLLRADARSDAPLDVAVDAAVGEVAASLLPPKADTRIGPYRLIETLGSGGMGSVYLAERADDEYHQRVAIKVIRGLLDPERVRRFRAERQILASLDHPSIARLLDGGTTEGGWPYLVMEHVDGMPVDRYVSEKGLDVPARLRLFLVIAAAVSHAHRHLVVHRDLKPANILVGGAGDPKLLDFGIAKLLESDDPELAAATATGVRLLTPEYAAPEQVRGEPVTTATDVYALGALLYELLTGRRPHRLDGMTARQIEHAVCEVDPPRPSAEAAGLDPDLDVITLCALQKDPSRRYASVDAFAEDVRRFLSGRPILARPATWRYRARRFAARHRYAVTAASGFVALLLGFSVVVSVLAARLARERDAAQQERDTARQVSDFLVELFEVSDPSEARDSAVTARELLDRGADRIGGELAGQPAVRSRLLHTIGRVYRALGLFEPSERLYRDALLTRERSFGQRNLETAASLEGLGETLRDRARYEEAEKLHRQALAIRRELLPAPHASIASALNNLGLTLERRDRRAEAEPLLREAVGMWRRTLGRQNQQVAVGLVNLSLLLRRAGRPAEAEPEVREAIAIRKAAWGDRAHPLTANALMQWAQVLGELGRLSEAEAPMRESLEMRLKVFDADHPQVGFSYNNLASLLHDKGDYGAAEPLYRAANAITGRRHGQDHPEYAVGLNNLASLLSDTGRTAEAEALYRQALAIRRRALGDEHAAVARGKHNLARALLRNAKLDEAEALASEALAQRRRLLGDQHVDVGASLALKGSIADARGRTDEALRLYGQSLELLRAKLPAQHPSLAAVLIPFATTLRRAGRSAEALPLAEEAAAIRAARLPVGHPQRAEADSLLAGLRRDLSSLLRESAPVRR